MYGSVATTRSPSAATTASRASSAVMPANVAGLGGHAAVLADHGTAVEAVLRPISKSFGSWPGVIFRLPVPKSVFT